MRALLLVCAAAGTLAASTTTTWEMNSWQDFIRGSFAGVALDRGGRLTLAPGMIPLLQPGQAAVWSLARAADGSIYAGTGNRGRLYRITPDGKSTVVWTADQPEIFAIAVTGNGDVLAATSPDGRVYRIGSDGKAVEYFNPKAKYIWSLALGHDGVLYVGTGGPANVYRVDSTGQGELWYQSGQGHVTSLAVDSEGRVLAGTEPNGILYRIASAGKAFVLYNANLPEIRAISVAADGAIYAAAMGGSLAARGTAQMPVSMTPMSVTVTATSTTVGETDTTPTQGGNELKVTPAAKQAAPQAVQTVMPATPAVDVTGVDKSAMYRINPDNTVETLWSSKDENIYDIAARAGGDLLITTDDQGRIYRLTANRRATLIAQTGEGEATRLLMDGANVLAATAETGRVMELSKAPAAGGNYESPVHDCGAVARWGIITWRQTGAGNVRVDTRTGNSARPDNTWSDWQPVQGNASAARLASPNARYVQWRAALNGGSPGLENVIVAYLPQNSPPVVRSISVTSLASPGGSSKASSSGAGNSQNAAYSVTVTDSGDNAQATSAGTPTQTLSRAAGGQIQISWQADDPDGDRLVYSLWFRPEDEQRWMPIRSNLSENTLLLDGDVLANGRYLFRVVASDRPSNPPEAARESDLVSSPVLIDNTPPMVTITQARRDGAAAELEVDARDGESSLRRCEYSVDAAPWLPVEAVDGLTDSPHEQFRIHVDRLSPGEHLIVVRVYDSASNAGLAKYVAPGE
jgi:hypothetical protein